MLLLRSWQGNMGRPVSYPCGTTQAYKRHLRHGETPCQPCKDAAALAKRLKRYKAKAGKPEEPEGLREALRGYKPVRSAEQGPVAPAP